MSKEREAFDFWYENVCEDKIYADEPSFNAGYHSAATHYQPLLDAKDAEISRLSDENEKYLKKGLSYCRHSHEVTKENEELEALLEQAREAFGKIRDGARNQTAFSGMSWQQIEQIAVEVIAAINAATGKGE